MLLCVWGLCLNKTSTFQISANRSLNFISQRKSAYAGSFYIWNSPEHKRACIQAGYLWKLCELEIAIPNPIDWGLKRLADCSFVPRWQDKVVTDNIKSVIATCSYPKGGFKNCSCKKSKMKKKSKKSKNIKKKKKKN